MGWARGPPCPAAPPPRSREEVGPRPAAAERARSSRFASASIASTLAGEAAVDGDGGAGHEVGGAAREEYGDARHVVDPAPTLGRCPAEHAVVKTGYFAPRPLGQLGVDPAGQHGVDL